MSAISLLTSEAGPAAKKRKVTLACESCRNRKSKCDGTKPQCGNCSQRSERCVYRLTNPQLAEANEYIESLVNKIAELECQVQQARAVPSAVHTVQMQEGFVRNQKATYDSDGRGVRAIADGQQIPEPNPARTLLVDLSSPVDGMGGNTDVPDTGDKFYGISSPMSFMKQFYNMTSHNPGSPLARASAGTTTVNQHQPSPVTTPSSCLSGPEGLSILPRVMTDYLLDLYWNKVYLIYPFVHRATFMAAYEQLWLPASVHTIPQRPLLGLGGSKKSGFSSAAFHCALNAMMVLGLQFSDLPFTQKNSLSETLTQKAKNQFDLDMLDDGGIYVVQTLLLLTQLFQFTTFPTRCWSTIGGACRLAQGLGLHLAERRLLGQFEPVEIELRKRIWHSCLMLDMVVSMTLGRPTMLRYGSAVEFPIAIDDHYLDQNLPQPPDQVSNMMFFRQASKLYTTLSKTLSQVYCENETEKADAQHGHASFDQLIELDSELIDFADQLPDALNWTKENTEIRQRIPHLIQQTNILHARYLHLRILLYRPSFGQYYKLNASLTHQTSSKYESSTAPHAQTPAAVFAERCSIICVRSAIDMIDLAERYAATNEFSPWWYSMSYIRTAAMVILLADTCDPLRKSVGSSVLASSWQKCCTALQCRLPQGTTVKACMQTLEKMHDYVLKTRTMPDHASNVNSSARDHLSSLQAEQHPALEQIPCMTLQGDFDLDSHQYEDYLGSILNDPEFQFCSE